MKVAAYPSPSSPVNDSTTDQGANGRSEGENTEHDTEVRATLAQGHEIGDNQLDEQVNATTTDTLDSTAGDQHGRVSSTAGDAAAQGEEGDYGQHHPSSAEEVA